MTPSKFNQLLKELKHLTDEQEQKLIAHVQTPDAEHKIIAALEKRLIDSPECPHCASGVINRHGKKGGMQRYRCKNCLKTFTATTNTPFARLRHKEKWLDYGRNVI